MKKLVLLPGIALAFQLTAQSLAPGFDPAKYEGLRAMKELNKDQCAEAYPWISPDGLRLYFTDGKQEKIMLSTRNDAGSKFSDPKPVDIDVDDLISCWLSNDELHAYVSDGHQLFFLSRETKHSKFGAPQPLLLEGLDNVSFLSGASLDEKENDLFLMVSINSVYGVAEFTRSADNRFTYKQSVETPEGYEAHDGQISPDGLRFMLAVLHPDGNEKICLMQRESIGAKFDFSTLVRLGGIDPHRPYLTHPSASAGMEWIVFMASETNSWDQDDLFIVHNPTAAVPASEPVQPVADSAFAVVETTEPAGTFTGLNPVYYYEQDDMDPPAKLVAQAPVANAMTLFPNPANEHATIRFGEAADVPTDIMIFNMNGELVLSETAPAGSVSVMINTSAMAAGTYLVRTVREGNAGELQRLVVQH